MITVIVIIIVIITEKLQNVCSILFNPEEELVCIHFLVKICEKVSKLNT